MKRVLLLVTALLALSSPVRAEDATIDLRYEPTATSGSSAGTRSKAKLLRPVRINAFSDRRSVADTFVGELKINGQPKRVLATTPLALYITDAFRRVYGEWGGKSSSEEQLELKGELTQFSIDETDGYQARVGIHFSLYDAEGRVLWNGHTSGMVKGSGRALTTDTLPLILSDVLRATFTEMLEDDRMMSAWSGKVATYTVSKDVTAVTDGK